ncbi:nucleotidyltransferase [Picosynechococcus sp. PCC 7003]|uniref:nucleotidyltransferase family protein n=1 Tax=Picosynechococcus sp. PCC 7003 TaxID=374981 RepID=UPI0008106763|nr:nucleotidyltransferase family protein [Picosynechococcus sp. PCC 7003]ANV85693.1 nucleotidyltransferase [Picosynechococcus sp. PCC 7003]
METSIILQESLNKNNIVNFLYQHAQELKDLGVKSLAIFGSVARNEATQDSDVDCLVELEENVGFFEFFQIKNYLEEILDRPVDLGTKDALKEHLRQSVFEDLIHVF